MCLHNKQEKDSKCIKSLPQNKVKTPKKKRKKKRKKKGMQELLGLKMAFFINICERKQLNSTLHSRARSSSHNQIKEKKKCLRQVNMQKKKNNNNSNNNNIYVKYMQIKCKKACYVNSEFFF